MASSYPGISLDMLPSAPPPPGVLPNFTSPVTLSDPLIAVSAITSVLSFLLLVTRLYCNTRITRSFSYDDIFTSLGFVFTLVYIGLVLDTRSYARHGWDLPLSEFNASYFQILFVETIAGALGFLFSKLGILFLLFRLFSPRKWIRYAIYVGVAWAALCNCTSVIVVGILCAPRSGESWASPMVVERCSHEDVWAVVQGSLTMMLDFYILFLPIPIVWGLQMERKRKVGILAIFVTGFVACVASTVGVAFRIKLLNSSSSLWNSYIVDILNIVESNVSVSVACMPAFASFFRHFFKQNSLICSLRSRLSKARQLSSSHSDSGRESSSSSSSSKPNLSKSPQVGDGRFLVEKMNKDVRSGDEREGGRKGYWKTKNIFSSRGTGNGAPPPQITRDDGQSRASRTGDFAFDFSNHWQEQEQAKKTRRMSMEMETGEHGPRFNTEEKRTPYDLV